MQKADNILSEGNQLHRVTAGGDKVSMALGPHPEGSALSQLVSTLAGKATALANTGCATQPVPHKTRGGPVYPQRGPAANPRKLTPSPASSSCPSTAPYLTRLIWAFSMTLSQASRGCKSFSLGT